MANGKVKVTLHISPTNVVAVTKLFNLIIAMLELLAPELSVIGTIVNDDE